MKNADYFSNYVTEDFTTYINRKRKSTCHGNHIEMQAMAEMYNRPVEVYQYGTEPINTFHGIQHNEDEPIRVSYHRNIHYNSVVNPNKATIGVGLGLPSFKPGVSGAGGAWDPCCCGARVPSFRLGGQGGPGTPIAMGLGCPPSIWGGPGTPLLWGWGTLLPSGGAAPSPEHPGLHPEAPGPKPPSPGVPPPGKPPSPCAPGGWGQVEAGPPPHWCPCTPRWSAVPSCSRCPPLPSVSREGLGMGGIWGCRGG
ncbi:OTUD5 protein, partial [Scopus umbretta]|nr:OTUD5 protein [Scopus umbretta]